MKEYDVKITETLEKTVTVIMPVNGIPQHLVMSLTRAKFEQLCDHLIRKTILNHERRMKAQHGKKN